MGVCVIKEHHHEIFPEDQWANQRKHTDDSQLQRIKRRECQNVAKYYCRYIH